MAEIQERRNSIDAKSLIVYLAFARLCSIFKQTGIGIIVEVE